MKILKQYIKTALCLTLSAAMVFTNAPAAAFAAEGAPETEIAAEETTQIPETQGESPVEEGATTQPAAEEEGKTTQPATEEAATAETAAEETAAAEGTDAGTKETKPEETTAEETAAEAAPSETAVETTVEETVAETEEKETDLETETETEVEESIQKLAFSDTDIAHGEYKEDGNNITWVIDKDKKLTVEGTGNFASPSTGEKESDRERAPWYENRSSIVSAEIKVTGMTDASYMFYYNYSESALVSIDLSGFDTSNVTNMSHMFVYCENLTSVDVSGFDTSNVTNMSGMFDNCRNLTSLDISGFDTSKVTDMSDMFGSCWSLTSLDVSGFDTGNVTDMSDMFSGCENLTSLDISGFDTSKVTDMRDMFWSCSLTSIDLSGFDTSKVTDMSCMFWSCSLTSIDLSGFDTSKVTDMSYMFAFSESLTSLDLSGFDTSNVTNMSCMFAFSESLTSVNVSGFDTSKVTDMSSMFDRCESLTSVDISSFDTSNVTDMSSMFYFCESLTSVDVSGFDTSKVTDMSEMFGRCYKLTSVDVSSFNTSNAINMSSVFANCLKLTSLDVSGFDTSQVTDMNEMFMNCESLTSVDVSGFDTGSVSDMSYMFHGCSSLESVDVSGFDTSQVTDMQCMFISCYELTSLDVSGFDTSQVTDMSFMFDSCWNLTSLDLSNFDTDSVNEASDMLDNCTRLTEISTPYNLKKVVALPTTSSSSTPKPVWYKADGTTIAYLPLNLEYSILITRDSKPEVSPHITARKTKTVYQIGETADIDDLTVMYHNSDGKVTKLAANDYTTNIEDIKEMSTSGRKTLTITYNDMKASVELYVLKILTEDDVEITMPEETCVYDGTPKTPVPAVALKDGGTVLEEGMDFSLSYKNNINAGESAVVTIIGINAYQGKFTRNFTIKKAAAPEAEQIETGVASCTTAQTGTLDISESFAGYAPVTGYAVKECKEDDAISGNVLSGTPTIKNGVLTYDTNAGTAGDFATVVIDVTFANYENSTLNVIIKMAVQPVKISGITAGNSVYARKHVSPSGTAKVETEDGKDVTGAVNLTYTYTGTQADNSPYAATADAPVNAGSYTLTVAVAPDSSEYTGSMKCNFTIDKAPLTITARDMGLKIGADLPKAEDYKYDTKGLLEGDKLTTEPTLACNIADSANAGEYEITISGADAGMNYEIAYVNGRLTVSETGETVEYYTVTFHLNGHGADITNTGVKAGSRLEKPADPKADGYAFKGWYKDKDCTAEWDFAADTVQADTTLYARWTADGADDDDNKDKDDDDSPYTDSERTPLTSISAQIANIKPKVYDGDVYEPVVKVTATVDGKNVTLTEGADYRVRYTDNTDAGNKGRVIVSGNGIYKGELEKSLTVSPKPMKKLKVITGSVAGTPELSTLPVYVYDGAKRLTRDTDYTLSIQGAQAAVTGKGNYEGSVTAKLTVYESADAGKLINPENVSLPDLKDNKTPYTGKAVKPNVTIKINDKTLDSKKDYKVQYQNNKNAGTAFVIVTGKGEYTGKAIVPFTIKAETNGLTVKDIPDKTYNGKLQKPAPTVSVQKDGKPKKLAKNKDYTVSYKKNLHAGTATITIKGKGNYAGLGTEKTFKIKPQEIKKAAFKGTKGNLTLTYSKRKLKEGYDYETPIYGTENKNKVEVTIKGKGDFTGELKKSVKTN